MINVLVRLKRIYSFWIELIALLVITYFMFEFSIGALIGILGDYYKANMISFIYLKPILRIIILLYFVFRNFIGGHSVLQMMFGIKFEYKSKRQLILKNVIDLITLPISLLMVLIKNKSIGDYVCKVNVCEIENYGIKSSNTFLYLMIGWFTVIPIFMFFAFSWRINKSEETFAFDLNNCQTIKDHIGVIKDFSFNDKILWTQYDKDGEYTGAKVINEDNKVFKVKIYYNVDDEISYLVIDGKKYEYEIERFDFNEYKEKKSELFEEFDDEIIVSEINNQKDALTSAREAYKTKYSKELSGYRAYEVFYDKENDVYMIHYVSSIGPNILGGDCTIIIESSGKVLLIQLGK